MIAPIVYSSREIPFAEIHIVEQEKIIDRIHVLGTDVLSKYSERNFPSVTLSDKKAIMRCLVEKYLLESLSKLE